MCTNLQFGQYSTKLIVLHARTIGSPYGDDYPGMHPDHLHVNLPDTLQAGACIFPPFRMYHFSSSYMRVNIAPFGYSFQFHSFNIPT